MKNAMGPSLSGSSTLISSVVRRIRKALAAAPNPAAGAETTG
jgi:hypothetical protein